MKHTVRIFEVNRTGQTDPPLQEQESLQVEASTASHARETARHALIESGWQVRAISHAVDGGLVAYVVKPDKQPRRRRPRVRRESELARR